MHSWDSKKDLGQFVSVIRAIRTGDCKYHRPRDRFDFSGFVFPEALFSPASSFTRAGFERVTTYVDVEKDRARDAVFEKMGWHRRSEQVQNPTEGAPNGAPLVDNLASDSDPMFTRDVDFTSAVFLGPAYFVDMTFAGRALFAKARFRANTYFHQARFRKRVDFEGAEFAEDVDFYNASFHTAVRFNGARFLGKVRFGETVFNFNAYFRDTKFVGAAIFSNASFNEYADFQTSTFSKRADFTRVLFRQGANFRRSLFCGETILDRTVFSQDFLKKLQDRDVPSPSSMTGPVIADFSGAAFEQPSRVRFRRVNQENPADQVSGSKPEGFRVRFIECDVRDVHFDAVHWNQKKNRMVLEDEFELALARGLTYRLLRLLWNLAADREKILPEDRYELVSLTYRQLVSNFERDGSYELAEDCYIGALEMMRLDPARPKFVRIILTLYRWASNYGSNYSRAFSGLVVLIALSGVLYALPPAGLATTGASGSSLRSVMGWHRVLAGLFHALEIASFQRDTLYSATTIFGRLISVFASILLPSQLALFLLSVRRRFRR